MSCVHFILGLRFIPHTINIEFNTVSAIMQHISRKHAKEAPEDLSLFFSLFASENKLQLDRVISVPTPPL